MYVCERVNVLCVGVWRLLHRDAAHLFGLVGVCVLCCVVYCVVLCWHLFGLVGVCVLCCVVLCCVVLCGSYVSL